ncbi:hypothetical protein [uncultured Desulfovibrio sp.]|uniref:hypothetical protein n=1 Tax=uncultured Desulfovibrio sp. TaxID=167968 RepID=UPI0027120B56|nr:hypothetical protein [uncultured Desulfovibrio sp.]
MTSNPPGKFLLPLRAQAAAEPADAPEILRVTGRSGHWRCTAPHGHTDKSLLRLEKGLKQNFLKFFSIKHKNYFILMPYLKGWSEGRLSGPARPHERAPCGL